MNNAAVKTVKLAYPAENMKQVHSQKNSVETVDVLMAEKPLLRRIIIGAGRTGADAEDILQE